MKYRLQFGLSWQKIHRLKEKNTFILYAHFLQLYRNLQILATDFELILSLSQSAEYDPVAVDLRQEIQEISKSSGDLGENF